MKKEADVKDQVKALLKKYHCWYTMPFQAGYGKAGVPDFLICIRGKFLAVETKFGKGQLTALQAKELLEIRTAGGRGWVVNEQNLPELESLLAELAQPGKLM